MDTQMPAAVASHGSEVTCPLVGEWRDGRVACGAFLSAAVASHGPEVACQQVGEWQDGRAACGPLRKRRLIRSRSVAQKQSRQTLAASVWRQTTKATACRVDDSFVRRADAFG